MNRPGVTDGWEVVKTCLVALYTWLVFSSLWTVLFAPEEHLVVLTLFFFFYPTSVLVVWDVYAIDRKLGLSEVAASGIGRLVQVRALIGVCALAGNVGQLICMRDW